MSSLPKEVIAPTVSAEKLTVLQASVSGFDRDQLIWSSGFLAGLAGNTAPTPLSPLVAPSASPITDSWTVFYATETGNGKRIAENLAKASRQAGFDVETKDLREVRPRSLLNVNNALFVLATHGIGEPPEGTEAFFEYWFSEKAPRVESLNYSVLALGDSSYADFCEIGRSFDARLKTLGARVAFERVDCDLDFEPAADRWTSGFISTRMRHKAVIDLPRTPQLHAVGKLSVVSKDAPFAAGIIARQTITGPNSSKSVQHIELDISGSDIRYRPGDSLAVMPTNPLQTVDAVLKALHVSGDETVRVVGEHVSLADALLQRREITQLSRPILDVAAAAHPSLASILADRERFTDYLASRQLIDVLYEFPVDWELQAFVDTLRALSARKYSIASDPDANEGEAHLTVALVDYQKFDRRHWGAASSYLAGSDDAVPVYVERNDQFRLPDDGDAPIIMIGAGTGVAPFRAFVEHRREHGHSGRNWLVFGDRSFANDFLYQLEWLRYRKDGTLTRLDAAFSRDQDRKIYVQHKLLENASDIYRWLQDGASLYVCGDANRMAVDVQATLLSIAENQGGHSVESAKEWLRELKRARRYQRDIY